MAADKIIAKGKQLAAHLLEAAEADIEFADGGNFTVAGTDRAHRAHRCREGRVPRGAGCRQGSKAGSTRPAPSRPTTTPTPTAAMSARSRSIPTPARSRSCDYVVVDDVGTVINPIGLKGQIHGGVAQGLGQALMEQVVYDRESGQILTGSFMDYAMPRADRCPICEIALEPGADQTQPAWAPRAPARPARSARCRRSSTR